MPVYVPNTFVTLDVRAPLALGAQSVLTALLITSTSRSSWLRMACIPILAYLAYVCYDASHFMTGQFVLCGMWVMGGSANFLLCFDALHIHPEDEATIRTQMRQWPKQPSQPSYMQQIHFTVASLWSFRAIGTDREARNVPEFPSIEVATSRGAFLFRQAWLIIFEYLVMDFFTSQPPTPEAVESWAPGKEWLWLQRNPHPVTTQDLFMRGMATTMNWYLVGRMMLDVWYRIFSVVFVGLGITAPRMWPPMFGQYRHAYTIRGYFGKFWHQLLRNPLSNVSTWVTRRVLRLPHPSLVERYSNILVVFVISGFLHSLLDVAVGVSPGATGGLFCFSMMTVGIILEDSVQHLWNKLIAVPEDDKSSRLVGFERVFGYLWVWSWLVILTPVFNYPVQRVEGFPFYIIPSGWSLVTRFS